MLDCLPAEADVAGTETSALPLHTARPATLGALRGMLGASQAAWLDATGFAARRGQVALLPDAEGRLAGAVLGLGGSSEPASPWPFGALPYALPERSLWRLGAGDHDAADAVLGWGLGAYRYRRFKGSEAERPEDRPASDRAAARLLAPGGTEAVVASVAAAWRVRDLINTPPNHLGPEELADAVRALAAEHPGATCRIFEGAALAEGFPLIAAVGAGSPRAPRVAILEWQGSADGPLVALCGKGVCFDSGGLDIKPSAAMLRMKKDMGGAAVTIGVAELVMRARLPVRLMLLVGAVENAVSGTAMRPLDVVRSRKGLTVEIGNTDAEGRLVLCDLLALAGERGAEVILDCATLTGAARVALGPDLPALFSNDEALAETLMAAGREAHDPLWRLPLHSGYDSWLDSAVADVSSVGTKPMAGAITAALFLQRFVPKHTRWAHMDLYAWNDSARPGRPEGGEAQAMRALYAAIAALARHRGRPDR